VKRLFGIAAACVVIGILGAPGRAAACSIERTPFHWVKQHATSVLLGSATRVTWVRDKGGQGYRSIRFELAVERLVRGQPVPGRFRFEVYASGCLAGPWRVGDRIVVALNENEKNPGNYWYDWWRVAPDGTVTNGYEIPGFYYRDVRTLDELLSRFGATPDTAMDSPPTAPPVDTPVFLGLIAAASYALIAETMIRRRRSRASPSSRPSRSISPSASSR
jgi:hypothetical protein